MDAKLKRLLRIIVAAVGLLIVLLIDKLTVLPSYLPYILYGAVYLAVAYDVLFKAGRGIIRGRFFDENFLMAFATIGAFVIGDYLEGVAVMLLYQIGELFQDFAVGKSRRSITSLMDIRPDRAVVLRGGEELTVAPDEVEVGEIIVVRAGERVPLDGVVIEGRGMLDTSALTGESVPRSCESGDTVLSGSINRGGLVKLRTEKAFYDSTVNKILDMVENAAGKKAKSEQFITRFARVYTPVVVLLAVLLAVLPGAITGDWLVWVTRALNFLVVSCPCALVISVPLSFFGGIGGAGKQGILIKGGNYLELLARADIFVFDKTGTLTLGSFEVTDVRPAKDRDKILKAAAIAERGSLHPVAKSIMAACGSVRTETEFQYNEHAGMGVEAVGGGRSILCGNDRLMQKFGIEFTAVTEPGTVVYVAENGCFLGSVIISDRIKDEAEEVVSALKTAGCRTIMLTGDNERIAGKVAEKLGIDEFKAGLLPGGKVEELERILAAKKAGDTVAFVGDGINDAPVLMRADIGIAMGALGSDSAIEAADVVLMHDTLGSIPEAKRIAKRTVRIVRQNIIFALAVKAAVLVLSAVGLATMWAAVFADVGVSVLAVLNAMRALKAGKARVKARPVSNPLREE